MHERLSLTSFARLFLRIIVLRVYFNLLLKKSRRRLTEYIMYEMYKLQIHILIPSVLFIHQSCLNDDKTSTIFFQTFTKLILLLLALFVLCCLRHEYLSCCVQNVS